MICGNCGNMLQPGVMVCPYCNTPVNQPVAPMMGQPMMGQAYTQPKKKHTVLWIILGFFGLILIAALIIVLTCKKLKCSVANGSFTIYYSDNNIYACTSTGTGKCDLSVLKESAKTYGVETVINLLEEQAINSGATCTK